MSTTYLGNSQTTTFKGFDIKPSKAQGGIVQLRCLEFTSLCPITSQPDYGQITIAYSPTSRILETKSVKLYLQTWRDQKSFVENIMWTILHDIQQSTLSPTWLAVYGEFRTRGGISPCCLATDNINPLEAMSYVRNYAR